MRRERRLAIRAWLGLAIRARRRAEFTLE